MAHVLVIEDEQAMRRSMQRALELDGHDVRSAATPDAAWSELGTDRELDVIVTDLNLTGSDDATGLEILQRVRAEGFDGVVIVVTSYGTIEVAVEAMRRGADEFVQKPIILEELRLLVTRALDNRRVRSRLSLYERLERVRSGSAPRLTGDSVAWSGALRMAQRFAGLSIPEPGAIGELPTILLLGETGSGKGEIARFIHRCSPEHAAGDAPPFVHVNCAALPASLIEAELFGHERGAFTDAKERRAGLFEMAEGGTIFLDETGEMPVEMQAKLLLVLENGRFRRIGGSKERTVRARIVAATNQDLEDRVKHGLFRPDLLFRLNALTIWVPPLSDRGDDVLLLAREFVDRFAAQYERDGLVLSPEAERTLLAHDWPGNVRELMNVMKRAALLAETSTITTADLALRVQHGGVSLAEPTGGDDDSLAPDGILRFDFAAHAYRIDEVERQLILDALEYTRGNVTNAAKLIGLKRGALRYRIDRLGLEPMAKELAST